MLVFVCLKAGKASGTRFRFTLADRADAAVLKRGALRKQGALSLDWARCPTHWLRPRLCFGPGARRNQRRSNFGPGGARAEQAPAVSAFVGVHRDMQGTAAEKLTLFEKLKVRGGFAGEDRAELLRVERMLRTFAATEK
jgi:hypothetical protein